jgi:hypothetical protein
MFLTGKDITQKKMMETTGSLLLHQLEAQSKKSKAPEEPAKDPTPKPG